MKNPSLVGENHFFTFNDDLSRFTWVYFFKNKSITFKNFKEFKALAETKCGQLIKCLRSNNGGEYVSR